MGTVSHSSLSWRPIWKSSLFRPATLPLRPFSCSQSQASVLKEKKEHCFSLPRHSLPSKQPKTDTEKCVYSCRSSMRWTEKWWWQSTCTLRLPLLSLRRAKLYKWCFLLRNTWRQVGAKVEVAVSFEVVQASEHCILPTTWTKLNSTHHLKRFSLLVVLLQNPSICVCNNSAILISSDIRLVLPH